MQTCKRVLSNVGRLLVGAVLGGFAMGVSAASLCSTAKLYISPHCEDCVRIQQEASSSIATLVRGDRLEVITLDTQGNFIGDSLPDFQVFHSDTGKLTELFQVNPIGIVPDGLVVRDVSEISTRLRELADQKECNTSSILPELSTRGVSSSFLDTVAKAITSFLLNLF